MTTETSSFDWDVVTGPAPATNVVELFPPKTALTKAMRKITRDGTPSSIGVHLAIRAGNLASIASKGILPPDQLRSQLAKVYYGITRLKRRNPCEYSKFLIKWNEIEQRLMS